ncbi:MAG: hypothetical protein ABIS86_06205, partial [Streptosporangiaceae bacterium]
MITRSPAAPAFRIAQVQATGGLTLTGVTFSNGKALTGDGGGILNAGAVTLTSSALTGNTAVAGSGGGIYSGPGSGAAATFTTSKLSDNKAPAGNGGALYSRGGTVTFTGSSITGNLAGRRGGGVASI